MGPRFPLMRTVALPLALLVSALALAGCADDGPKSDSAEPIVDEGEYDDLDATEQTGVIRGVAVDLAVRPIPGVLVSIQVGGAPRNTTSADSGAFGFDGLDPGTYFLEVSKPGYQSLQVSTDVVAGVSDPPIVKVQLVADPASVPYYSVVSWSGFIECSTRVGTGPANQGSVGVNACNGVGNQDVNFPVAPFDRLPEALQGELVWESTQAFGSGLSFVVGPPSCVDVKYGRADGPSTLVILLNATTIVSQMADDDAEFDPEEGLCYRVFSYVSDESLGTLGLVTSQKFEAYFHAFYNMLPPDGWRFSVDGNPAVPS